jgi:voltage-gated potassium channel
VTPNIDSSARAHRSSHRHRSFRRMVYHMLGGEGHEDPWVKLIDRFLILLIVANVAAVVAESVEALALVHGPVFHAFDVASVIVFSVEYLLRLWTAVELPDPRYKHPLWGRLRWAVSPMALIDLLAVLPFYLGYFVEMDLRAIRVLRVLRVFKLSRYSMAMNVLAAVARQESRVIGATMFILMVVTVLTSSVMYLLEHRAQPHIFGDIPSSMWWAIVTLTTLGYGDMVPVTPLGRVLGAFTAILGVGMIALPAGVLASGFSEQMRIRREEYREAVDKALEDGRISKRERRALEEARKELGLSEDEAVQVLQAAFKEHHVCPHCGKSSPQHKGAGEGA